MLLFQGVNFSSMWTSWEIWCDIRDGKPRCPVKWYCHIGWISLVDNVRKDDGMESNTVVLFKCFCESVIPRGFDEYSDVESDTM